MENLNAIIERCEVLSEADRGPFWVRVLRRNGSIANSGANFATTREAYAFVEGLDMAARLFGCRVLLDQSAEDRASLR
jgi:hypothetical protein